MIIRKSLLAKCLRVNGIVLYPFIFLAPKDPSPELLNHEQIHWEQIKRVGIFKFYTRYLLEYVMLRRLGYDHDKAYRNISFEKEAYAQEKNLTYLAKL